ncbi:uncharacterized protein LOC128883749 [Hylaeus volcanicus]|uniref:uncharacterized protein LOC128883749 n=1 Tax=Hylaeus volcanicus TaxID=313075 RepID=UPI0023B7C6DC|nr:uncharacterized protein LOC128883749 [Hylaeus volcanicus]
MTTELRAKSIISEANKYLNARVRVRLIGGRELIGVLRGHDAVLDLVLDDTLEILCDYSKQEAPKEKTRFLGLVVARGTAVTMIWPEDGTEEIENPFVTA